MISTKVLVWVSGIVIALSSVVGGVSVWALNGPLADSSTQDKRTDADDSLTNAAPDVFIGDELGALLLTDEDVANLFPLVTTASEISPVFAHAGESEGATGDPATCFPLIMNDPAAVVGSRHHRHEIPSLSSQDRPVNMHQYALQYPDTQTAERLWQYHIDATEKCTEFNYVPNSISSSTASEPDAVYTLLSQEFRDDVSVIVGSLESRYSDEMVIFAMTTNTIVRITVPLEAAAETDPSLIACTVGDRL